MNYRLNDLTTNIKKRIFSSFFFKLPLLMKHISDNGIYCIEFHTNLLFVCLSARPIRYQHIAQNCSPMSTEQVKKTSILGQKVSGETTVLRNPTLVVTTALVIYHATQDGFSMETILTVISNSANAGEKKEMNCSIFKAFPFCR